MRLNPGADYFTRCAPAKVKARAIGQLEALSLQVRRMILKTQGFQQPHRVRSSNFRIRHAPVSRAQ